MHLTLGSLHGIVAVRCSESIEEHHRGSTLHLKQAAQEDLKRSPEGGESQEDLKRSPEGGGGGEGGTTSLGDRKCGRGEDEGGQ